MDPRMGRRSGYHDQEDPEIISPQAARLNGGVRSGPRKQDHGPAPGGAGPRSRRPDHAGIAGRHDDFEDIHDNVQGEGRRRPHASERRNHDAEEEAGFADARPSARRHDNTEDGEGSEEDGEDLGLHNHAKGNRQSYAEYAGFENRGTRPGHHDGARGGRRHDHAEDDDALETAGARPSRRNPTGQLRRGIHRDQEASEDNERYGGSRRGRDNRTRDRSEEAHERPDLGEQEGRFVPYTFRMLHPVHVEFLVTFFKVRTSKVKEWCDEGYIRMDKQENCETNIDPLLDTLPSKDRELYHKTVKKNKNEMELRGMLPWGPSHARTTFDGGYHSGRARVRRDHKADW